MPGFYEFFAGGGLVRAGLGAHWTCLFANDIDPKKALSYTANWGRAELKVADVRTIRAADLPGQADLVWGSFPCQDLSLAGGGAGLQGERSGSFHPFWAVVRALSAAGRGPRLVAIENVCGALTAHGGGDFQAICKTFADAGYRYGPLVIDAALFVPQSRPRLFVIGVRADVAVDTGLVSMAPLAPFHTPALQRALGGVDEETLRAMVWWNLPAPARRNSAFADLIEETPTTVAWPTAGQTQRMMGMMSPTNLAKVEAAKRAGRPVIGGVYRRTRPDAQGVKGQRAEVRFDDIAGCLRTPAGGSSRQAIILVDGPRVRSRLISARETARLMGLGDDYILPKNYNDAYHLTGDGVVVGVVRHLAEHVLEPLLS